MVESMNFFLINESDKAKILEKLEDLCSFIHDLVKQEHVLIEFRQFLSNLEHLIKQLFDSKVQLKNNAKEFIKFLLNGGMNSNTREFKKLGIYCLYCIAINLKEDKNQCNIDLFSDDEILKKVFSYIIDK